MASRSVRFEGILDAQERHITHVALFDAAFQPPKWWQFWKRNSGLVGYFPLAPFIGEHLPVVGDQVNLAFKLKFTDE